MQDYNQDNTQAVYITDAQKERWPKVDAALKRLCSNEDFRMLMDEITLYEAQRNVAALGDDSMRANPHILERVREDIQAIGIFQGMLRDIGQRGMLARQANMTPEELNELVEREQAAQDENE